jgi:hypothetical protein
MDLLKKLKLNKTRLLVTGLVAVCAIMILIAAGRQKVNLGFMGNPWRTVWLIEFNWVAALVLALVAVVGLVGGTWLCYREGRK